MFKDLFRTKPKYVTVRPQAVPVKQDTSAALWQKCPHCSNLIYKKDLEKNYHVCEKCGFHFRISIAERLHITVDEGSFREIDTHLESDDPLKFPGYPEKLAQAREKTGLDEALIVGRAAIHGHPCMLAVADFDFMAGSMGSVVGERVTRTFEMAIEEELPVVIFSAGGGGARMQEGILSLMQMAKTSQAVERHSRAGLLYVSVLTNPTLGGVYASFASLGDILLAEPGALIGFAGPRIVEEATRQSLPKGFQSAEFAMEHGMIDKIVHRKDMRQVLGKILSLHRKGRVSSA
ncbi:MAG TPA: acetyl-CoA carboxylase carboxyltransferase subunit beta [Firmicutes bacterium]|nr:acetyl-CoA carboxylase carboxyltransferase subunit beta [Bacillota bacterium]